MSIHEIGSGHVPPLGPAFGPRDPDGPERASGGGRAGPDPSAARGDRVEISAEGLARAAAEREALEATGVEPARAAEIRERIAAGFYDDAAVAEAVADRLLASGDLGPDAPAGLGSA